MRIIAEVKRKVWNAGSKTGQLKFLSQHTCCPVVVFDSINRRLIQLILAGFNQISTFAFRRMKTVLFIIFFAFVFRSIGQIPSEAGKLFNKGVVCFEMKEYYEADSLFREVLKVYQWPEAYFNKALSSY